MIAKSCPEHPLTSKETLVSISGAGNVAQFTALKVIELGATVLSLSDSKGALISQTGFTKEIVEKIGALKLKGGYLESLASEPGYTYHAGKPQSLILSVT
jgi:glutamate dehydrogenase (NADP+)